MEKEQFLIKLKEMNQLTHDCLYLFDKWFHYKVTKDLKSFGKLLDAIVSTEEVISNPNKLKDDTPILVKNEYGEEWKRRYFHETERIDFGEIYTYAHGYPRWTAKGVGKWVYAKFPKDWEE